jgi:hypothetical protein
MFCPATFGHLEKNPPYLTCTLPLYEKADSIEGGTRSGAGRCSGRLAMKWGEVHRLLQLVSFCSGSHDEYGMEISWRHIFEGVGLQNENWTGIEVSQSCPQAAIKTSRVASL